MQLEALTRYPIYPGPLRLYDRLAMRLKCTVAFCSVCGRLTLVYIVGDNLRETCICIRCRCNNRQRQIALVLCAIMSRISGKNLRSLKDISVLSGMTVYNTESAGALHNMLARFNDYACSEYFGPGYRSGERVKGVQHQDLMDLSYGDESFDLVVSTDVLEHVPVPYQAHEEIYRVLKPGGRHVFTVPFYATEYLDEQRAYIDESGKVVHLKEPAYHGDPLRPDGVLVFNIFSLQMLVELKKIGFRTNMYSFYKPFYGVIGNNAIVFEAIKE